MMLYVPLKRSKDEDYANSGDSSDGDGSDGGGGGGDGSNGGGGGGETVTIIYTGFVFLSSLSPM